eukprot:g8565.t1
MEPAVRILLHEGWELATFFHQMPDEEIKEMLPVMARGWTPDEMEGLRREAKRQKRFLDIGDGTFYHHQKLLYKDASMLEKKIGGLASTVSEVGTSLVLARKTMPRVTWKSRLQKALANAPDEQHRAKAEEKERQRRIGELMKLLEDAGFLESLAREPEATKQLAARVAAGRRASTLRQHVKYGRRVQVYMESIYGTTWLRSPGDFIGYVALLLEEPCGRSAPGSLFKCIAFLEAAAEVSPEKRLSNSQSIHNYLKEVEQGTTWTGWQRTKAARMPVEVARAWEIGVLDYLRYICSKNVAQLESLAVDDVTLHRPSLKLIMSYEYQTRKEAVEQVPQAQSVVHPDDLKGTLRWVLKAFIMANLMGNGESFTIRFVDTLKNPKGIFQVVDEEFDEPERKKAKIMLLTAFQMDFWLRKN